TQFGLLLRGAAFFVVAVDREVGLDEVAPGTVRGPAREIVNDGEQLVAATLVLELCYPVDDTRPCLRGVEARSHATSSLVEVHGAAVPRWHGIIDQRLNEGLELSGGLRGIGAQRAVRALRTELGHEVKRALKPGVKRQAAFRAA